MRECDETSMSLQLEVLQSYLDMASIPYHLLDAAASEKVQIVGEKDHYNLVSFGQDCEHIQQFCAITVDANMGISILYEFMEREDFESIGFARKIIGHYSKIGSSTILLDQSSVFYHLSGTEKEIPFLYQEKFQKEFSVETVSFTESLYPLQECMKHYSKIKSISSLK